MKLQNRKNLNFIDKTALKKNAYLRKPTKPQNNLNKDIIGMMVGGLNLKEMLGETFP